MNLHAKLPFDPFNVMKNAFPGFHMPTLENDPYHPYATFNQEWLQNYQAIQQHFWQGWWDWLTWQQWSLQQAAHENARWFTHCMELRQQPQTLYRYTRMNWQKPYLGMNAQMLTSARILTQLWTDTFKAWQHQASSHAMSPEPRSKQELTTKPAFKPTAAKQSPHQKRKH
ncbi:hypothetical protein [Candidatus Berkiella aquae]|uniref:Uncharacterized protein n=1 Tax=Candidatus Berkiella aquae TaxID=295108 RepID=A0A0Q9YJX9_9GAMM|nr:hypothetical protein [Candidatus Berkiella aquae]MCS5710065.1 hypothetical protein [Candidatus Berkiella aquae]